MYMLCFYHVMILRIYKCISNESVFVMYIQRYATIHVESSDATNLPPIAVKSYYYGIFPAQYLHYTPHSLSLKESHNTIGMFPPAIDIIPTLLDVVYSNGKYTK